jgi:hypothetical protein
MSELWGTASREVPAAENPLPIPPRSVGERFDTALEATLSTSNFFSQERNLRREYDAAASAFREAGAQLENPFDVGDGSGFFDDLGRLAQLTQPGGGVGQRLTERALRERRLAQWDETARTLQEQNPDARDLYPTSAELRLRADQAAAAALRQARREDGMGGGIGAFAGSMAGIFADPVQAATLPVGAPYRIGASLLGAVVRTAVIEGAVAAGTQAVVETRADPFRRRLGFESEAAEQIAMAGLGGAIIGGGLRAVLGLVSRGLPDTPAGVAAEDAGNAARLQSMENAGNPGGNAAHAEHLRAMDQALQDVAQGGPARVTLQDISRIATNRERMLAEASAAADAIGPGTRFHAFTPAGRSVLVEPRVVELRELVPSHSPDGMRNAAYPHEEGIQPRPRGDAPLLDQVRDIAARLIPERLLPNVEARTGSPIIGEDLVVESGNGRVMALTTVYSDPNLAQQAAAYREALAARGWNVEGFDQPVLVSQRITAMTPSERQNFVREVNARGEAEAGPAQRAMDDARLMGDALPLWRGGDVDSVANVPFVRRALEALGPAERAGLLDAQGRLNGEGVRRIGDALLARAYGEELGALLDTILQGGNDGLRALAGALRDTAGEWARMRAAALRGQIDPAMDVTADLVAAVRLLNDARRVKVTVRDLLAQADIERVDPTDTTRALLAAFHRDPDMQGPVLPRQKIAQRLAGYVETAMDSQPGGGLFDLPPVRPGEQVAAAARREAAAAGDVPQPARAADDANLQGALDGSAEPEAPVFRFDPEAVDPAAAQARRLLEVDQELSTPARGPIIDRAALQEARRIAADQDIAVPAGEAVNETGQVVATTRGARDLLDEAEAALADADEALACMLGGAA